MTHFLTLACTVILDQQADAAKDFMPAWVHNTCGLILCIFLGLLGGTIIWFIWDNKIPIASLLSEANGDASLSRLQLLIFTFVIAFSYFYLVEKSATLPQIPDGVLTLLGISASTYAVGKGISYSRDEGVLTDDQIKEKNAAQVQTAQAQAVQAQATAQAAQAQAVAAQAIVGQGGPAGPVQP